MSEMQDADTHGEGPIKTPKQLIWTVLASFVVPVVAIILLTQFVASGSRPPTGSESQVQEAIARRIQPVGSIVLQVESAPGVLKTGEHAYAGQCSACHATGAAGAPKAGDVAAWAPRIKTGLDALLQSALKGKNAMPPQGGGALSETEIARAVVFMANQAGAKFEEPKAPAAAASASQ